MDEYPPLVQDAIRDLFAKPPDVVRARNSSEQRQLRALKIRRIRFIEDYLISRTAARLSLNLVWQRKIPFCLFLRSFSLKHRYIEPVSTKVISDPYDTPLIDASNTSGGRFLKPLSKILGQRIPLITIANPDEWLPHRMIDAPFANIVVQHRLWQYVTFHLISACQLIVMHKAANSPGVDDELGQIRRLKREALTIVVREPDIISKVDPDGSARDDQFAIDRGERRRAAMTEASARKSQYPPDPALNGFTVLNWRDDETMFEQLAAEISRRLNAPVQRHFMGSEPPLTDVDEESAEQREYLTISKRAYEVAGELSKAGDLDMAEELFFESIGTSAAGRNTLGRASGYMELGKFFLIKRHDAESARIPLEYASGHFLSIEVPSYASQSTHLYAAAQLLCGEPSGAAAIVSVANKMALSEVDRKWLENFWSLIKMHFTDSYVAAFVAKLKL